MRTRFPALRTLPSSTAPTFSVRPISRTSSCFPLKTKDDVRAVTIRSSNLTRALRISSVIPSVKYSFSGSELMLTKGSTAMDFLVPLPLDNRSTGEGTASADVATA